MPEQIKLRQCPFCGEKERLYHVENITGLHYIECGKCGAAPSRLGAWDRETAEKYWNSVNRWIPCSSQLPDEDTDVMIYVATELFLNTSVARLIGGTWFEYSILSGLRQLDGFEVLAWMPLPEPPESEVQE